jgi:putative membrane-bound dehydrogenase-like protein
MKTTKPSKNLVPIASLVWLACLTVFAQPQGAPQAPAPTAEQPPAGQAPVGRSGQGGPAPGSARGNQPMAGDFSPKPPIQPLTPQEEQKRFILPPGYRMELVLSDPEIINPTAIAFDGNGRLYVNEMRSYMLDADGSREFEPVSRISVHESTKGDGTFDHHSVFIDKLILPRFILPLDKGSVLTMETNADDIFKYTDTTGDGVAEKKELFFSGAGRRGNLEHQQSGFIWAMDNWIYSTYNAFRIRWTPGGVIKEPTAPNFGQWGLTQDDYGKPWFVDAGGERGPINFQTPIVYGAFNVADQFEPGFEVTWPAPGIADMQGGMSRIRMPIGVLNHFTATCGPDIFRGDRLPADLRGDLLFAEPVGRLVRRSKVVVTEGVTQLRNPYPNSEFILSLDPLFRPVNMATAPDGTLYIVDMYHGIIQESQWTEPGSYLRAKIHQLQLDKVTGHGRIWRLVYDGIEPERKQPRMLDETPAQLVTHLDHPNGWWRDTAQKLLVLRQDKSVVPALQTMARNSTSVLGRFHAMWTLEGLGALDATLARALMKDLNPLVRVQAIRASESLYKAGDTSFDADFHQLVKDEDTRVSLQAMLTLKLFKAADLTEVITAAQAATKARGVQEIGSLILRPPMTGGGFGGGGGRGGPVTPAEQALVQEGAAIYAELCSACHGPDGKGMPVDGAPAGTMKAPPLAGSPRVLGHRDYLIKAVLHGLTGPVQGNTYTDVMVPMGTNKDDWMAAVTSYVRTSLGNNASVISPADVERARAAAANRNKPWTVSELEASLPVLLASQPTWKATASQNPDAAANALATGTWSTGAPQQAGMWFQVELPAAASITEIQFDAAATPAGGRGGRGAAPGPPVTVGTPAAPAGAAAAPAPAQGPGGGPPAGARAAGPGQFGGRGGFTMVSGFPRAYTVQVSSDGSSWSAPVAQGQGVGTTTVITFAPVSAKFVRITQTATPDDAPAWSIQKFRVYQPAGTQGGTR